MARKPQTPASNGAAPATTDADDTPASRWYRARSTSMRAGPGKARNKQNIPMAKFIEAYKLCRGNALNTAEMLGCTRANVHTRVKNNPELRKLQEELLEEELDLHEDALRWLSLGELHPTSIMYVLNNKGRHRGWGDRGYGDRPPVGDTHYHLHVHGAASSSKLATIEDSDLVQLIEQRRQIEHAPEPDMIDVTPSQQQDEDARIPEPGA